MRIRDKNQGFSLVELLIVVAVVSMIAAIAIPNLLATRRSANQASALRTLRTISSAQAVYHATLGDKNYATAAQLYNQQLIDRTVAAANNVNVGGNPPTNSAKSGYRFRIQITAFIPATQTDATFVVSGVPATTSGVTQTGAKRLCVTQNGLMKNSTASLGTHYTYATCNTASAFSP